jgi:hypothetical protein
VALTVVVVQRLAMVEVLLLVIPALVSLEVVESVRRGLALRGIRVVLVLCLLLFKE